MRARGWLGLALALAACGGVSAAPSTGPAATPQKTVRMVTPSRLVPEIDDAGATPWFADRTSGKYLLAGLRIVAHEDGRVERANERFPSGAVNAMPLPARLGGGYVFYQSDSQGTRLWRAASWTDRLAALSYVGPSTEELIAGFDRLYLRTKSNKLMALDATTGQVMPLGPLPAASAFGAMVFADGWRGVVDTDLRGPLVTFDAGATWRALPIPQRVVSALVVGRDPVLYVNEGAYRVAVDGQLSFVRSEVGQVEEEADGAPVGAERPLGGRALRLAIEHGYPDDNDSAVMVHRGALWRVSLPDGVVKGMNPDAVDDDDARCTGARVGIGFGFVCGVEGAHTTIYAFRPPLSLTTVARFDNPRFVSASGNGALVVRGKCGADDGDVGDMRTYCIVGVDGSQREIAVRGEIGAERVVALSDGRVAVLVPPRLGRPGRLTIIAGDKLDDNQLRYPEEPARAVTIARRGLWLEGFEQRGKDSIGGWVEAGGPVVGVRVKLDGTVELGKLYDDDGQLIVSGPFAVAISDAEHAFESTDGGKSWSEFELPSLPESPGDAKTRACSAVGCALRGWLRVGWGEAAVDKDLQNVEPPEGASVASALREPLRLRCGLVSVGPAAGDHEPVGPRAPFSTWAPFRGALPPALGKDQLGVDKASDHSDAAPAHVYAWGPKGADWLRAGWWTMRFDDRFALDGVRSSAPTRPPWSDETAASEAIGARQRGAYYRWEAEMDPAGDAAIVSVCKGTDCAPHAVGHGRPLIALSLDGATKKPKKPGAHGIARVGDTWYYLADKADATGLSLWRAELGVLREAVAIRRLDARHHQLGLTPLLVRRALGGELGLLFVEPADPASGHQVGRWHVLPLDPSSGELGAPIDLGSADLDGAVPRPCAEHDDGWLLATSLATNPAIDFEGAHGYVDDVELRLRLDPADRCADGLAAAAGRNFGEQPSEAKATVTGGLPLIVRERYTGQRWQLRCEGR